MDASVLAAVFAAIAVTLGLLGLSGSLVRRPHPSLRKLQAAKAPFRGAVEEQSPRALRRHRLSSLPGLGLIFGPSHWAQRVATDLEKAGLRLRVGEYIVVRLAFALGLFVLTLLLVGPSLAGLVTGLAMAGLGYFLPHVYVHMRKHQRLSRLDGQLEEALTLISSSLRSGFGLAQAMDAAASQIHPPMADELRRTLREADLGSSTEETLTALSRRVGSRDLDMVITAILIQRGVGGNLAEVLDNVAYTMRERARIKGEIKTLTTPQRMTGYIVAGVPLALAGLFFIVNPDYMSVLITDPIGRVMLALAAAWEVVGIVIIRRILAVEI
jgi:tight adherence protein B